ncbi:hypothetical protein [Hymenobacter baengnokdamensis]|uniref:hypothetical protein n=1 Tax=Hymenobacter baengnokdamensis TaxID=2615203 RepID=UPI001248C8F8|nr:hypothetical protein [Hymenobacter baengnokdamensis]
MNNILTDFAGAIDSIPNFYYNMDDVSILNDELVINKELSKPYERRFVSQLKSSYDTLIAKRSLEDYSSVYTDLEVIKKYIYTGNPDRAIEESYHKMLRKFGNSKVFEAIITIPDFLIHHAQSDWEHKNQKLVVEAKTSPKLRFTEFALDFFKLNVYAEKHNFQNSVYLIVHNSFESIQDLFTEYRQEGFYLSPHNLENIYLFLKKDFSSELIVRKASSLL